MNVYLTNAIRDLTSLNMKQSYLTQKYLKRFYCELIANGYLKQAIHSASITLNKQSFTVVFNLMVTLISIISIVFF